MKKKFESYESELPVTTAVDTALSSRDLFNLKFFNMPGISEDNELKVKENIEKVQTALESKEQCLIFYVLTVEGGRIRGDDCKTFGMISAAFDLNNTNFAFIVNKWDSNLEKAKVQLRIKTVLSNRPVIFISKLKGTLESDKEQIVPILSVLLEAMQPAKIKKISNIVNETMKIEELKKEIINKQLLYDTKIKEGKISEDLLNEERIKVQQLNDRISNAKTAGALGTFFGALAGSLLRTLIPMPRIPL